MQYRQKPLHIMNSGRGFRFFLYLSFILIVCSCKKDTAYLGAGFIPNDKLAVTGSIDTLSIVAYDTLESAHLEVEGVGVLGSMNDPVFGLSTASIVSQFAQLNYSGFGDPSNISIRLSIIKSGFVGDTNLEHTIHVYQVTEALPEKMNTDFIPKYEPSQDLANGFKFRIVKNGNKRDDSINVPLDSSFKKFLYGISPASLGKVSTFIPEFHGLYITVDSVTSGGGFSEFVMSNVSIDFMHRAVIKDTIIQNDSLIIKDTVIITKRMSLVYSHSISDYTASKTYITLKKATVFRNNYSGKALTAALDNKPDTINYIHGMDGITTKYRIPNIMELTKIINMPASINKAEFIIPVDLATQKLSSYSLPINLNLYFYNSSGNYSYTGTPYTPFDPSFSNRNYDSKNGRYIINITRNIQYLLEKRNINLNFGEFVILPSMASDSTIPDYGPWAAVLKRPILRIYYTTLHSK